MILRGPPMPNMVIVVGFQRTSAFSGVIGVACALVRWRVGALLSTAVFIGGRLADELMMVNPRLCVDLRSTEYTAEYGVQYGYTGSVRVGLPWSGRCSKTWLRPTN